MKALIFGVTGQDGSYLSEMLVDKGIDVVGVARRSSVDNTERLNKVKNNDRFTLIEGDVIDPSSINNIFTEEQPDYCFNMSAQSFVAASFKQPFYTFQVNACGVLNILEAIRNYSKHTKLLHASTSELFGNNYDNAQTMKDYEQIESVWEVVDEYKGLSPKSLNRLVVDKVIMHKTASIRPKGSCIQLKKQSEKTKFAPDSPYAVSKLAAHHLITNYRVAYNLHLSTAISFNHECIKYDYPLLIRIDNKIDIQCIQDMAIYYANFNEQHNKSGIIPKYNLEVWDQNGWSKVNCISWFKNNPSNKHLNIINARNAIYCISDDHICIKENGQEISSDNLKVGDKIKNIDYPHIDEVKDTDISIEEAELLGLLVGDGSPKWGNFTNKDVRMRDRFEILWHSVTNGKTKYYPSISGFTQEIVGRIDFSGGSKWLKKFQLYSECKDVFGRSYKRIPHQILNASIEVMEAFLMGYNLCDGLKKNPCNYRFKNFKTNSPVLAAGLLYLIHCVTQQRYNLTIEESWYHGKQQFYYSINLLSDNQTSLEKYNIVKPLLDQGLSIRQIYQSTGMSEIFIRKVSRGYHPSNTHHLEKINNEIKKIIKVPDYDNWFFDIETASGTLHAGIGQGVIHNSERRGEQFVTRKITKWIGEFCKSLNFIDTIMGPLKNCLYINSDPIRNRYNVDQFMFDDDNIVFTNRKFPKLRLGNLDTKRDWSYAPDICDGMIKIIEQDKPDDYVLASGETHSIREFLDGAFGLINITDWSNFVVIDPKFYRPSDVEYLLGDATKARTKLGWKPKTSFKELVRLMVYHDLTQGNNSYEH